MAISDSYLKSCLGRERDKVEEKADRDGLWVRISKRGRYFFYRFRFLGKQDKMTIGSYPEFGLKAARDEVAKWAAILARGENPGSGKASTKPKLTASTPSKSCFANGIQWCAFRKKRQGRFYVHSNCTFSPSSGNTLRISSRCTTGSLSLTDWPRGTARSPARNQQRPTVLFLGGKTATARG